MKIMQSLCTGFVISIMALAVGCSFSSHDVKASVRGELKDLQALKQILADPGPIRFQKHLAARWEVERSGLINLQHPIAVQHNLVDTLEPIEIYVYSVSHPQFGTYLIDSGVAESFGKVNENTDLGFLVRKLGGFANFNLVKPTKKIAAGFDQGIAGVFLTHLHLDHIMGFSDLSADMPVYVGPGETSPRALINLFTRDTTDRLLQNASILNEWKFHPHGSDADFQVIDIFSDGSLWALSVPGHSPGSTAYLARTPEGPKLMVGDACHTRWGWMNQVEPGTFSLDQPRSAKSLKNLIKLVSEFPQIEVHLGHQSFSDDSI